MATPAPEQPAVAPARRNGWFSWLVLFVVGAATISLAAVYLPSRIKMLGLFAIGQGLLIGWLGAWLAVKFDLPSASRIAGCIVVFLAILGGEIGTGVESFRVYRSAREERVFATNPKLAALLRNLADAKSDQSAADVRQTIDVNFADYLQFRVSDLKIQSQRWATVFWISEVVLGGLAGTWMFRRLAKPPRLEAPEPPAKLDE
jgi:hypothetical protein